MIHQWKHDELLHDLADHLCKPERMMWLDMQLGPSGSSRPDIFTMNKSYSNPRPIAYEIKASVSDYRSDITSGKWQKYLSFASAVIFCVPKGLITKADLPSGCGLMVRSEKVWRTAKAPMLEKAPSMPRDAWMKLLIDGVKREHKTALNNRARGFNVYSVAKKNFDDDVAQVLIDIDGAREKIKRMEIDQRTRSDSYSEALERERDRVLSTTKNDRDRLTAALREFSEAFGFEATAWDIRSNVERLKNRCDSDSEVARLRECLSQQKQVIDDILLGGLPEITNMETAGA